MIHALILIMALIIAILSGKIAKPWLEQKRQEPDRGGALPGREAVQLVEEVARLRERVQVLERVVTDNHGSIDLDRRIDALRDR